MKSIILFPQEVKLLISDNKCYAQFWFEMNSMTLKIFEIKTTMEKVKELNAKIKSDNPEKL